jgi:hypothetical protein
MICAVALMMIFWLSGQATSYNFEGFTKNPIEHIINPIEKPIEVKPSRGR